MPTLLVEHVRITDDPLVREMANRVGDFDPDISTETMFALCPKASCNPGCSEGCSASCQSSCKSGKK